MAKVSLQSAQNARLAMGNLVDAIMVPTEDQAAKAIEEEGAAYAAAVATKHENLSAAKKGTGEHETALRELKATLAPSEGNFCAFLEALSSDHSAGKANCEKIKRYLADLGETPPDVGVCKIKNIRGPDRTMILLGIRFVPIRTQILDACRQLGYEVRSDAPPASAAEEELSAWLEALG